MVALITVSNSTGVVAQCDAKCYDGHDSECVCICGGRNHGVGLERALENNVEQYLGPDALRAYAKQHGYSVRGLELVAGELERSKPMQRRRWLSPAADVRRVRARLELTQAEFAAALGVSRRTVIRAELRGFEIPWRSESRDGVREAWAALQVAAAGEPERPPARPRSPARGSPAKCHVPATSTTRSSKPKRDTLRAIATPAIAGKRKRLRLSRDRLREWKARRTP